MRRHGHTLLSLSLRIHHIINQVTFRLRLLKMVFGPIQPSEVVVQFAKAHTLFTGINRFNGQVFDWYNMIRSVEVDRYRKGRQDAQTQHQFFIVEQRYLQAWTTSILNLLDLSKPKYIIRK